MDAKNYGFSPAGSGKENAIALNKAIQEEKIIVNIYENKSCYGKNKLDILLKNFPNIFIIFNGNGHFNFVKVHFCLLKNPIVKMMKMKKLENPLFDPYSLC